MGEESASISDIISNLDDDQDRRDDEDDRMDGEREGNNDSSSLLVSTDSVASGSSMLKEEPTTGKEDTLRARSDVPENDGLASSQALKPYYPKIMAPSGE